MTSPQMPPPRPGPRFTPSRTLTRATYRLLMADRAMIVLLFCGGAASAAVLGGIVFPAWFWGHISPTLSGGGVPGLAVYAVALWASAFVSELVMGAVVAAAMIHADGSDPSVRAALAVAWSRRRELAAWAAVSTVVGVLMGLLERFGLAGLAVRLLAGISWAVATIFAVPLVICEGTMPAATVKRSSAMVRDTFGATLRSNIRLAAPWVAGMVAAFVVASGGVVAMVVGVNDHHLVAALVGAGCAVVGGVLFFFASVTSSALSAYLNTLLYRYAVGLPIPGIDPADLPPLRGTS